MPPFHLLIAAQQGIPTAKEREVAKKDGALASAFREFASQPGNAFDSLGALGARNLMGMGFIRATVRMFERAAISLGWTGKADNMGCMASERRVSRGLLWSCMCPVRDRLSRLKSGLNQSKYDKRRAFAEEEGWMVCLTPS